MEQEKIHHNLTEQFTERMSGGFRLQGSCAEHLK